MFKGIASLRANMPQDEDERINAAPAADIMMAAIKRQTRFSLRLARYICEKYPPERSARETLLYDD
ncbi:MAG: hypothetical protein A3J24_10210 [Deltaproteobacteria bacterium RIFCSPLOWO2_02_FULL_53_8]|nr:MAG: hypothetical protein A3J24_10210 [Deltaproteobacteria bacterium RIFCSPLOWO2_02_FULL_53_8]